MSICVEYFPSVGITRVNLKRSLRVTMPWFRAWDTIERGNPTLLARSLMLLPGVSSRYRSIIIAISGIFFIFASFCPYDCNPNPLLNLGHCVASRALSMAAAYL